MTDENGTIGSVVGLWRYPVKSMMGEELNAAEVGERGLFGDRAYALVDAETGKVASAKQPRKWGKLFECRAAYAAEPRAGDGATPVQVTLPDGARVASGDDDMDARLSALFQRQVTLSAEAPKGAALEEYWPDIEGLDHQETVTEEAIAQAAPPGTFFDLAPIHLLTTATIDRLRELYPRGRFEVRRFRPNIVVTAAGGEPGFIENEWVGHNLAIGEEVRLSVLLPCPRCVMTTLAQGDLPADAGILRTAAQHNQAIIPALGRPMPSVGVYAVVLQGGTVRRGDAVRVE